MRKAASLLILSIVAILAVEPSRISGQAGVDKDLLNEINKIKAINNHAHPQKNVAEGDKPDDEYDALPLEAIPLFPLPVRLSPTNPEFIRAWHDLGDTPLLPPALQFAEFAVHDWDLATALGLRPDALDPQVAELGLEFMRTNLTPELRGGAFGPEQPAPPDAGPYDRIAAYAGRPITR